MKHAFPLSPRWIALFALFGLLAFASGCGNDSVNAPATQDTSGQAELSAANPIIQAAMAVQDRYTPGLMKNPDIVGTATGLTDHGQPAVLVFTAREISQADLPQTLDGYPVIVQVTGPLEAKAAHTAKQTAPIQLGTSGGWTYDLANGYCCGGTLGSLIQKNGLKYILSNYHVLYADIVSGGNGRTAQAGDAVIQPGLIDVRCVAGSAQVVGYLVSGGGSLPGGNVDAGIASVKSGMVRTDGAILEIGTISATTRAAAVGLAVKKSGRTTGLTRSSITGINGTVSIQYSNECAGGNSFAKTYTGQIIISNARCKFLNGGDSGSLLVEDVTTAPKAVGLLFAGSTTCNNSAIAIANPIGQVLSYYGATMVGQ
jgi:hypothetical protein